MSHSFSAKSLALHSVRIGHLLAGYLPSVGRFRPLRGSFSAYQRLLKNELEGAVLVGSQPLGECPEGSMTELAQFRQHDHQPWPVFWTLSHDAALVGKQHLWRDPSDRLCIESVYDHPAILRLGEDRLSAQIFLAKPQYLEGAWTSLASKWNEGGNYFHWLLDGLTRLMVRENLPESTQILLPSRSARFVDETIEMLGLTHQSHRLHQSHLQPERYYFCAPTAMTGVHNPLGFQWLRDQFSPYFGKRKSGPPIFLTRRASTRIPGNISEIEQIFSSAGFEIVDCGAIPVAEQIRKVSEAPAVAGLHGAAMTNILWVVPGAPVLELFQPGYRNACYEQMAFQGQLQYSYLFVTDQRTIFHIKSWLSYYKFLID